MRMTDPYEVEAELGTRDFKRIVECYTKVNCVPHGFLLLLTKLSGRRSSQEQGLYGKNGQIVRNMYCFEASIQCEYCKTLPVNV
ncbi:hypothetical protein HanXRQr2_Chr10g0435131 [Helianthus annuus]|uniref:Uncharacterized protein n=1 Tax=Helianthus annuus TaxID=4232 RepID=A0A9K3HXA7_HELAN|nr:hypothetical protein HanXRQr2_Chr10g0435131 [Helianthus annuus]